MKNSNSNLLNFKELELIDITKKIQDEGHKIIFIGVHGSHLYGLETKESDMDFKGIYIPSKKSMFIGDIVHTISYSSGDPNSKNVKEDIDIQFFSIQKFIKMVIKGEIVAIDMIHTNLENILYTTPEWVELQSHRNKSYSKNMAGFLGYIKKQSYKYGIKGSKINSLKTIIEYLNKKINTIGHNTKLRDEKIPYGLLGMSGIDENISLKNDILTVCGSKFDLNVPITEVIKSLTSKLSHFGDRAELAAQNKNVDFKAMSHAIRCGFQLKEIFETGDLIYPLKEREYLKEVKLAKHDFISNVEPTLLNIIQEIDNLSKNSNYPELSDSEFFENLCVTLIEKSLTS